MPRTRKKFSVEKFKADCREPAHGLALLERSVLLAPAQALSKDALMSDGFRGKIIRASHMLEANGYADVAAWMRRKLRESRRG